MEMMAPLQTLLWLMLLQLDKAFPVKTSNSQPSTFIKSTFLPVNVGQNVTLNCIYTNDIRAKLYWFKQSLEHTQSMVSSYFEKTEFYNKFKNSRFSVDNKINQINLEITNVQLSDSGVYHCVSCVAHQIQFLSTVHVIVKELNAGLQIEQRDLETAKKGRSLKLDCSVRFGSCDGHHRVHWFRQSEESATGVLYSHGGGSSDQCERNPHAPTNSCVYSLNVSSEQTGTYYCAVAACGQVLFGNGTRVKPVSSGSSATVNPVVAVLSVGLAVTSILAALLAYSLCRLKMKYKRLNTAVSEDNGPLSAGNTENQQDTLHYSALNVQTKPRRPRNTAPTDCVYSAVR